MPQRPRRCACRLNTHTHTHTNTHTHTPHTHTHKHTHTHTHTYCLHVCQCSLGGGQYTPTPSQQHSWTSPLLWKSSRSSSADPTPVTHKGSDQFLTSYHRKLFYQVKGTTGKSSECPLQSFNCKTYVKLGRVCRPVRSVAHFFSTF